MKNDRRNDAERRRHGRKGARFPARLRISLSSRDTGKILEGIQNVIALAETRNISIGGMSLKIVGSPLEAKKSLTPSNAAHVVGRPIEVTLEGENMVIWGDVVRTDRESMELAIVIYKVSDVSEWKRICSESDDGISIFPDSPSVRKKRRS
ncbi:MAG TPA: hypothetical protein PLW83_06760 [Deltaproteobacteria bacterium]|nr:hypothetical protein [Deltaproteobacteria bacterium]